MRGLLLAYAAFLLLSRVIGSAVEVPLWASVVLAGVALVMPLVLAIVTIFTPVLRGWERYLVPAILLAVTATNLASFAPIPPVIMTDVTNCVIGLAALLMMLTGAVSVRAERAQREAA